MVLKEIPYKAVKGRSKPPPELTQEVLQSGVIHKISRRGKHVLHSDGAWAYPAALKKMMLGLFLEDIFKAGSINRSVCVTSESLILPST